MNKSAKIVHDPIHGSVRVSGIYTQIMDRPEMQRLRGIRQLGCANLVFPGANHTRFEHCLGAYHLSGRMADSIGLGKEDTDAVRAAGLLHDICHAPYSHTLESVMEEATGSDHMDLAHDLIMGKIPMFRKEDEDLFGGMEPIGKLLADEGIDPEVVCGLISSPETTYNEMTDLQARLGFSTDHFRSKDYIHQIIHGPVDCDQMDYLMRDSLYTGVTAGHIDCERILATMRVHNDRICISRSGAPAAEGLMVARSLMFTSVYFHQAIRIINRMIVKAVEASDLDLSGMYLWNDADLTDALITNGGTASSLIRMIRSRRLYKKAYVLSPMDTTPEMASALVRYYKRDDRRKLEKEIADKAGIDESKVCVEMPSPSVLLNKVQIGKTDVSILEPDGKMVYLSKTSPIAKSLQSRDPFGWSAVVACPPEHREAVRKASVRIIEG